MVSVYDCKIKLSPEQIHDAGPANETLDVLDESGRCRKPIIHHVYKYISCYSRHRDTHKGGVMSLLAALKRTYSAVTFTLAGLEGIAYISFEKQRCFLGKAMRTKYSKKSLNRDQFNPGERA